MKTLSITSILTAALLTSGACDDASKSPTKLSCPAEDGPFTVDTSRVTGTLAFDPPTEPLGRGDSLVVSGTTFHEDGLAIREVRVAGAAATLDSFNFGRWSATVSYEQVVTSGPTSAQGQVTIQAVAIDACGKLYPFATAVVEVDPTPHINIDQLSITVEYPEDRTFIPASGSVPALITIAGTGRAAGASVAVTVDSGTLRGLDASGHVTLATAADAGGGDGSDEGDGGAAATGASATLIFTPAAEGTVTIAATVEDKLAVALVKVVGPPTLSPRRATLVPGSSIEVDVAGATDVKCTATSDDDLVASHFDTPLSSDPMAIEVDEGGRRVIVITAVAEPAQTETEVVVSCQDDFGQVGSGRYRLGAAAAQDPPAEDGSGTDTP